MPDAFELHASLPTPLALSWRIITEPDHLRRWFGQHLTLEAQQDGVFREVWSRGEREIVTSGHIDIFEPPTAIGWTWADDDWTVTTYVRLRLEPQTQGTTLHLVHSGWDAFPEPLREKIREAHESGWLVHLENLTRYASRLSAG